MRICLVVLCKFLANVATRLSPPLPYNGLSYNEFLMLKCFREKVINVLVIGVLRELINLMHRARTLLDRVNVVTLEARRNLLHSSVVESLLNLSLSSLCIPYLDDLRLRLLSVPILCTMTCNHSLSL